MIRIKKRKVSSPISSLSPVPIWSSDPSLTHSPLVQLQLDQKPHRNLSLVADAASSFDPHPSDHPSQPPVTGVQDAKTSEVLMEGDVKRAEAGEMMMRSSNHSRKGVILGAELICEQSGSSRDKGAGGRWCEGEKAFPLKKRRGSLERRPSEETASDKKMKTKVNKKCELQGVKRLALDHETIQVGASTNASSGARKKGRGGALLQGSRCSRVNGRGWRCCQQTLVGYSLCEHHLGKGKLRSISNVRSRSKANDDNGDNINIGAPKKHNLQPLSSFGGSLVSREESRGTEADKVPDHGGVNSNGGDGGGELEPEKQQPAIIVKRKKMKLGLVKARSFSSLLGLANEAILMAENEN